eukprot:jgi/Psemu1/23120/gm1.23120_g
MPSLDTFSLGAYELTSWHHFKWTGHEHDITELCLTITHQQLLIDFIVVFLMASKEAPTSLIPPALQPPSSAVSPAPNGIPLIPAVLVPTSLK